MSEAPTKLGPQELQELAAKATRISPYRVTLGAEECEETDDGMLDGWWLEGPDWVDSGDGYFYRKEDAEFAAACSPERIQALAELWDAAKDTDWDHDAMCPALDVPEPGPCACGVEAVAAALKKLEELP